MLLFLVNTRTGKQNPQGQWHQGSRVRSKVWGVALPLRVAQRGDEIQAEDTAHTQNVPGSFIHSQISSLEWVLVIH